MDRGIIARRYAQALWLFASKNGDEDEVYTKTLTLADIFVSHPAMWRRMMVSQNRGRTVAALVEEDKTEGTFGKFIHLLIKRHREEFLREICFSYQNIYRRKKRLIVVTLATAVPVPQGLEADVRQKLEVGTRKTVHFNFKIDQALLGGYTLHWDNFRIDASVAGRLRQMHKKMLEIQ